MASDLHLEFLHKRFPEYLRVDRLYTPWADVLVLAGDIHKETDAIRCFAHWPHPVLYVLGNHEFYDHTISQTIASMRQAAKNTAVIILDRDEFIYRGVRFLG
ncbi:MAG: metallophosphoesterase, partial [Burkholderiaceae bacterium]